MEKELRKLQLLQTDILEDIDEICAQNSLTYYMIGGTLLGAVRHKGFIPWDDDVDLVMYRHDYNRLIRILQEQYSNKYFVQTFDTDPYYTRYIAKVRLNNTEQIENILSKAKSHQGIYVDIFPLDYVNKTGGFLLQLRGMIIRWLFAYKSVRNNVQITKSGPKAFWSKYFRWVTYFIPQTWINKFFDYICEKDNKKQCRNTTNFASHFKWKKQLYTNEVYGNGVKLVFEGHLFNAPKEYEYILNRLYGNYMELPPKEQQITHNLINLDFGPYDSYLEDKYHNEICRNGEV